MTPDEKYAYTRSFPVHVGVDTGKRFHVLVARGPDGKRRKAFKVEVSRSGFDPADEHPTRLFPEIPREQMLVGLEFAGHHGFTFAHDLSKRGYPIVNVLPAHTKKTKEIEDNSPLKTDAKDAALICKLVGDGTFVRFPFLRSPYVELRLLATQRHRLTVEENRFKNRLQGVLDLAWPVYVGHWYALEKVTPIQLLERWPLPQDLAAASWSGTAGASRSRSWPPPPTSTKPPRWSGSSILYPGAWQARAAPPTTRESARGQGLPLVEEPAGPAPAHPEPQRAAEDRLLRAAGPVPLGRRAHLLRLDQSDAPADHPISSGATTSTTPSTAFGCCLVCFNFLGRTF